MPPRKSHPQDKAGEPPPERRCVGIVGPKKVNAGERCTKWAMNGRDTCISHSPDRNIPSGPPPERRCHGKALDKDGHRTQPCKLWAIRGLTLCRRHGGANAIMRAAGERRVAEEKIEKKARALALRLDIDPVDNPLQALALHIGEEVRLKEAFHRLVADLEEIRYKGAAGEQIRAEITLYERALDRVGTRLTAYARLNIDERLAVIQEKQAEAVIKAIDAALAHAGITGQAAVDARQVAARELRSVA
jgi:hypothetical protein